MAPKETKSLLNPNAIKVAAWDPGADKDNGKKLRSDLPAQGNFATNSPWRAPQAQNPGVNGFPGQTQSQAPVGGVAHLSPTRRLELDKHQTLMSEVVAVANHALGQLEGGSPNAASIAQAGHLDTPEKSGLWSRLSAKV